MKKNFIILMLMFIFVFALSSCSSNDSSDNKTNNTKTVEPSKPKEPTYLSVLVNDDFKNNFTVYFIGKPYYNSKMNQRAIDVKLTKKSDFLILNAFKLYIEVYRNIQLDGGVMTYKYVNSALTIAESNFNKTATCTLSWPCNSGYSGSFNDSECIKLFSVTSA